MLTACDLVRGNEAFRRGGVIHHEEGVAPDSPVVHVLQLSERADPSLRVIKPLVALATNEGIQGSGRSQSATGKRWRLHVLECSVRFARVEHVRLGVPAFVVAGRPVRVRRHASLGACAHEESFSALWT